MIITTARPQRLGHVTQVGPMGVDSVIVLQVLGRKALHLLELLGWGVQHRGSERKPHRGEAKNTASMGAPVRDEGQGETEW